MKQRPDINIQEKSYQKNNSTTYEQKKKTYTKVVINYSFFGKKIDDIIF